MPICDRRPGLASLNVPMPGSMLGDGIKTPLPHTPMVGSPVVAPMVMTPDTPGHGLDLSPLCDEEGKAYPDTPFSEAEDELIRSYLAHPPRPLRHNYPPHSLPPPEALEELLLQLRLSPSWPNVHSSSRTRSRLLEIARQRVAEYQSGPKRQPKVVYPLIHSRPSISSQQKGQWALLNNTKKASGGFSMRQENSMDSLYGDSGPATFSEALRLSSTLQDNASQGINNELSSVGSLSSPLDFTFTFNPSGTPPLASAPPNMAAGGYFGHKPVVRPTSLLQRGRSFTGYDLANPLSSMSMTNEETNSNDSFPDSPEEMGIDVEAESANIERTDSPETEGFLTSPPSSISSSADDEDMTATLPTTAFPTGGPASRTNTTGATTTLIQNFGNATLTDISVDSAPYTPLNPTFLSALTPDPTQHTPSGVSTPAITLTVDSPHEGGVDTPRLIASLTEAQSRAEGEEREVASEKERSVGSVGSVSPTTASFAFSRLSIAPRPTANATKRNPPGAPAAQGRRPRMNGTSPSLSRSLSEGMINLATTSNMSRTAAPSGVAERVSSGISPISSQMTHSASVSLLPDLGHTIGDKHTIARPMVKRQKSNTPELSVFVPRPAGRVMLDELRSPFEHKPAGTGAGGSVSSSGSNTPTGLVS